MSEPNEHICPSCGKPLTEDFGTDPCTGIDEHTFQCTAHDCMQLFEAEEIIG